MEDTITTTKERVLEAAKDCSTAERVLKKLFPEAFPKPKYVQVGDHFKVDGVDGIYVLARTGMTPTEKPVIRLINVETGQKLQEDPIRYDYAGSSGGRRRLLLQDKKLEDRLKFVTIEIFWADRE